MLLPDLQGFIHILFAWQGERRIGIFPRGVDDYAAVLISAARRFHFALTRTGDGGRRIQSTEAAGENLEIFSRPRTKTHRPDNHLRIIQCDVMVDDHHILCWSAVFEFGNYILYSFLADAVVDANQAKVAAAAELGKLHFGHR